MPLLICALSFEIIYLVSLNRTRLAFRLHPGTVNQIVYESSVRIRAHIVDIY